MVSAVIAASRPPAAPRRVAEHRLDRRHRQPPAPDRRTRCRMPRASARSLCGVAVPCALTWSMRSASSPRPPARGASSSRWRCRPAPARWDGRPRRSGRGRRSRRRSARRGAGPRSKSSSSSIAAPSPMFMPARPRSNGRQLLVSMTRSALKPLKVSRVRIRCRRPAPRRSGPDRIASAAWPIAIVLEAHAATMHERSTFEAEMRRDHVDGRAVEMIPDVRRPRAVDTASSASSRRSARCGGDPPFPRRGRRRCASDRCLRHDARIVERFRWRRRRRNDRRATSGGAAAG